MHENLGEGAIVNFERFPYIFDKTLMERSHHMVQLEDQAPILNQKIQPLVKQYEQELKNLREKINNDELDAGSYLEAHKDAFFDQLEQLSHQIKNTVFEDIKNKKIEKPDLGKLQAFMKEKLYPLKDTFRQGYEKLIKEILGEGAVEGVLNAFDGQLAKFFIRLFTTYGQQLDDM